MMTKATFDEHHDRFSSHCRKPLIMNPNAWKNSHPPDTNITDKHTSRPRLQTRKSNREKFEQMPPCPPEVAKDTNQFLIHFPIPLQRSDLKRVVVNGPQDVLTFHELLLCEFDESNLKTVPHKLQTFIERQELQVTRITAVFSLSKAEIDQGVSAHLHEMLGQLAALCDYDNGKPRFFSIQVKLPTGEDIDSGVDWETQAAQLRTDIRNRFWKIAVDKGKWPQFQDD